MCCASRETKNIWWYLFSKNPNRRKKVFTKRWWVSGSEYIFHDSIGQFWNKYITCKIFGHRDVQQKCCSNNEQSYCYKCNTDITTRKD